MYSRSTDENEYISSRKIIKIFLPFNFDFFFVTRSKKLIKEGNVFHYMFQVWYIGIQIGNVNIYIYSQMEHI